MSVNESTRRYQHSDIGKAKTKEYQLGDVYKKYLAIYQKSDRFKELKRKYMYKRLYGVTIAQYEEMYTKQNGLCAILSESLLNILRIAFFYVSSIIYKIPIMV